MCVGYDLVTCYFMWWLIKISANACEIPLYLGGSYYLTRELAWRLQRARNLDEMAGEPDERGVDERIHMVRTCEIPMSKSTDDVPWLEIYLCSFYVQ